MTKEVKVLLDQLQFPNGVQLSPEEDFVLVAETTMARIRRCVCHKWNYQFLSRASYGLGWDRNEVDRSLGYIKTLSVRTVKEKTSSFMMSEPLYEGCSLGVCFDFMHLQNPHSPFPCWIHLGSTCFSGPQGCPLDSGACAHNRHIYSGFQIYI